VTKEKIDPSLEIKTKHITIVRRNDTLKRSVLSFKTNLRNKNLIRKENN